ncbi:hypothetical protein IscW_ISCW013638 [Ixodes scapularis]|uniref:Uncharacterized protein n=1 Tax=Ixodes scapularis TaxID=6945 RepID=B7QJ57_IXOSC|nr:hypothetical protein IscW_ISCW013638 [Ixodes scapularis]|eukprot:XP_002415214.1 hypothetical protein IscW_ISCW013638 [Ixodes scapularis]
MKILETILLQSLDSQLPGATVLAATRLTQIGRKDTYIKIRSVRNLLAIDTYRPLAIPEILALKTLHFQGKSYATASYMANDPSNARGVIHGVSVGITDEEIRQILVLEQAILLTARRLGKTHSILITVEGPKLPCCAFLDRVAIRIYPHRPMSTLCTTCLTIGHSAEVCPNTRDYAVCPNCSKRFPPNQDPSMTCHERGPFCHNCEEE